MTTTVADVMVATLKASGVRHRRNDSPLHPQYVAATIDKLAAADAVFTADVGTPCIWARRSGHDGARGSVRRRPSWPAVVVPVKPSAARRAQSASLMAAGSAGW